MAPHLVVLPSAVVVVVDGDVVVAGFGCIVAFVGVVVVVHRCFYLMIGVDSVDFGLYDGFVGSSRCSVVFHAARLQRSLYSHLLNSFFF